MLLRVIMMILLHCRRPPSSHDQEHHLQVSGVRLWHMQKQCLICPCLLPCQEKYISKPKGGSTRWTRAQFPGILSPLHRFRTTAQTTPICKSFWDSTTATLDFSPILSRMASRGSSVIPHARWARNALGSNDGCNPEPCPTNGAMKRAKYLPIAMNFWARGRPPLTNISQGSPSAKTPFYRRGTNIVRGGRSRRLVYQRSC